MREFKDSGIEWLGEIPKHWEMRKCQYILSWQKGKNPKTFSDAPNENIYLTMDFLRKTNEKIFYISDTSNLIKVFKNDILLLWDGSNAGEFIVAENGYLSSTMAVIKFNNINKKFAKYFLTIIEIELKKSTKGMGIPHVNGDIFRNMVFLLPPLKEQEQIAEFLDKKCEKISNFIDKKQKLITLLEEKKQALINECVTKGLGAFCHSSSSSCHSERSEESKKAICHSERSEESNNMESKEDSNRDISPTAQYDKHNNIQFKDSGIKYLGKIPKHWEVRKLKFVISTNIGLVYVPEEIVNNKNEGYPVLRANNIQNGKINYQDLIYVNSKQIREKQVALIGDLLMCVRNGSDNLLGKTAKIMDNDLSFGAFTAIIRSRFNDYLYWIFQTDLLKKSITNFSMAIGIGQISQDDIKNFTVPFPPLQEQKEIAQFLDSKIAKIDTIIEKTKKQIELIKEYKTTLISEAVCGRISLIKKINDIG